MPELWFAIAAMGLTAYVVLDGFDFGAGTLHHFVARTDEERRQVIAAIGPYWDGNEVWLLATGGVLFLAFPAVLAAGLSGFYFAIFLVLWTLILRGISIEFRGHVQHPLWHSVWDFGFTFSSTLLPILFGAALGNLIRGLPIGRDGWFSLPLFTDFTTRSPVGILDWYTIAVGVFAWLMIAGHGALFLAWKTDGPVHDRSRRAALRLYGIGTVLLIPLTIATSMVNVRMLQALPNRPVAWLGIAIAFGGLASVWIFVRQDRLLAAFMGSCAFLVGMLVATAACVFPVMLRAIDDDSLSLTAYNSSAAEPALRLGIAWWGVGFAIAIVYFAFLFTIHRGKIVAPFYGEH
jgi:cytochrome d ubiquinol oxidase subunit II